MVAAAAVDPQVILQLSWIGFYVFCVLSAGFTALGMFAFFRARDGAAGFSQLFERVQIFKMATVMLIVIATTYLALFGIIDSTGAVGIYSGIAGYVLGAIGRRPRAQDAAAKAPGGGAHPGGPMREATDRDGANRQDPPAA